MAHFINLNAEEQVFKLKYADMVRRCDESERLVSFVLQQANFYGIEVHKADSINTLTEIARMVANEKQVAVETLFDTVEKDIETTQLFIKQQTEGSKQMKNESNHLIEYYTVLKKAGEMIFGPDAIDHHKNRPSFASPEDELLANKDKNNTDSDGSEDHLFDDNMGK